MTTELFLHESERKKFESLPPALRTGWVINKEGLECYETPRQLRMRYFLADFTAFPEMESIVKKLQSDPMSVTQKEVEEFHPEMLENIFFILGAKGLAVCIEQLFKESINDEVVFLLSVLSTARHKLLQINQSATHV